MLVGGKALNNITWDEQTRITPISHTHIFAPREAIFKPRRKKNNLHSAIRVRAVKIFSPRKGISILIFRELIKEGRGELLFMAQDGGETKCSLFGGTLHLC